MVSEMYVPCRGPSKRNGDGLVERVSTDGARGFGSQLGIQSDERVRYPSRHGDFTLHIGHGGPVDYKILIAR